MEVRNFEGKNLFKASFFYFKKFLLHFNTLNEREGEKRQTGEFWKAAVTAAASEDGHSVEISNTEMKRVIAG